MTTFYSDQKMKNGCIQILKKKFKNQISNKSFFHKLKHFNFNGFLEVHKIG